MASLQDNVADLNQQILSGQILPAFEQYYADDVVMIDAGQPAREGKAVNRQYEEAFVNGLTEFRGASVKSVALDEANSKAFVEWHFDFSHKDYGSQTYDQVAVQTWEGDQIKEERFYKI